MSFFSFLFFFAWETMPKINGATINQSSWIESYAWISFYDCMELQLITKIEMLRKRRTKIERETDYDDDQIMRPPPPIHSIIALR